MIEQWVTELLNIRAHMHRLVTKPVTNKGFHLVVITNICVHKMCRHWRSMVMSMS